MLAPSPSPHSVLMPVARTASYDVRNPHLVQHGLKETTKLVVDHMQVGYWVVSYEFARQLIQKYEVQ